MDGVQVQAATLRGRSLAIEGNGAGLAVGPLALAGIAFVGFAVPGEYEGPTLVPIGPGHALSALDTLALVPMLAGIAWLEIGIWMRRAQSLGIA